MSNKHYRKGHHYSPKRKRNLRRRHGLIICSGIVLLGAAIAAVAIPVSAVMQNLSVQEPPVKPTISAVSSAPEPIIQPPASSANPTNQSMTSTGTPPKTGAPAYQSLYPDLYVKERPKMHVLDDSQKIVYLTFDDGPSDLTAPLLDVLKKYNVKATFFDCRQNKEQEKYIPLMKRCVDEGHVVAVHSYSHQFKQVYASVESYLEDFNKMYELIKTTTGKEPANFFRFPGGSKNGYSKAVYEDIIKEMTRRGFIYYDWDGDSGDAGGGKVSGAAIYQNSMKAIHNGCNVILMHNIFGKQATLEQVENIIRDAQKDGYVFKAMDGTLDPTHGYLMTNKEFIPAALANNLPLSDWRLQKENRL